MKTNQLPSADQADLLLSSGAAASLVRLWHARKIWVWPLAVLVAGLSLTGGVTNSLERQVIEEARSDFNGSARRIQHEIGAE